MKEFFRFIASPSGRVVRIIAGLTLISTSTIGRKNPNWFVASSGMVPLSAGIFDWCVIAPLFGMSFFGKKLRKQIQ